LWRPTDIALAVKATIFAELISDANFIAAIYIASNHFRLLLLIGLIFVLLSHGLGMVWLCFQQWDAGWVRMTDSGPEEASAKSRDRMRGLA
jgi:hypothetical protein